MVINLEIVLANTLSFFSEFWNKFYKEFGDFILIIDPIALKFIVYLAASNVVDVVDDDVGSVVCT